MLEGCEASWFVDPKSPEQIADAVTEIAKKDLNSVRKSAYEHYKRHFSPDAVTLSWLGLLGRIG
jgi:glycosyltransferase involved in cell wall biosynthesis